MTEEIHDSPAGWVSRHIRDYVATDGEKGMRKFGVTNLLLITRGRLTGKLRRTALIYGEDDGRYVLVASNGGSARHPLWYLNLRDNPEVRLQIGAEVFAARAERASGEEKERLFRMMADMFPQYDGYRKKTRRDIPVIVLTRS